MLWFYPYRGHSSKGNTFEVENMNVFDIYLTGILAEKLGIFDNIHTKCNF